MSIYEEERLKYQGLYQWESKKSNLLSLSRLFVTFIAFGSAVQFFRYRDAIWLVSAFIFVVIFLILVRWHRIISDKKKFYKQLVQINQYEIAALNGDFSNFPGGDKYVDPHHAYTYDLDVFGNNSIFQYVNRTANVFGADRLADYFLKNRGKNDIITTQDAIKDLSQRLEWRQKFLALGQIYSDKTLAFQSLLNWADLPTKSTSGVIHWIWKAQTIITTVVAISFLIFSSPELGYLLQLLAVINLIIVVAHAKKFKTELSRLNAIHKIVAQYGALLQCIENEKFNASKLKKMQSDLYAEGQPASKAIQEVSNILHQLQSVQNLIGALLFNSLFIYHVHILLSLEKWKLRHGEQIKKWLEGIGEMEALCSFAHYAFNNPEFIYPKIEDQVQLQMKGLGHPLIPKEKRICNDIEFINPGFVILTGSNMSGKSTFLRTVGLNLLLAKTGAPICADKCSTFSFDIYVSMKLSDSLHDNESYFYAELKRLKRIIDELENGSKGFVLLDEVLRGTNSNDKLTGTLGLIETMVRLKSTGMLATHDLAVCDLSAKHPSFLRNMCFEVEMTTDSLVFDYKLRDGVCINKSASFLMRKMGVI